MELSKGVNLHFINSHKYKDITISFRFQMDAHIEENTKRTLLSYLIQDRSKKYTTKKAVNDVQDMLYGASLHSHTVGYGKSHILEVLAKFIDPQYITNEENFIRDLISFYKEMIFNPLINEETLTEAKQVLHQKLLRLQEDPAQYVFIKGLTYLGKGSALAISSLGEDYVIDNISVDDMLQTHHNIIHHSKIDIIVSGNITQALKHSISDAFQFQPRNVKYSSFYIFENKNQLETLNIHYKEVKQANIMMMWQTNCAISNRKFYALRLACALFGQYPSSLLFQEVREKHSLCYSIHSNIIAYDGVMCVNTGVDFQNVKFTIELIQKQWERICEGDFSEDLLETTKLMMTNSMLSHKDSSTANIIMKYQNILLSQNLTIEDKIQNIKIVTKQDVIEMAKACSYQCAYVLTKQDKENL